jgi:7-carboxy-7-deazaguanine synthase
MSRLRICESFISIQGETRFAGLPFYFIRLSGCSLRCSYCDTRYAHSETPPVSLEEILEPALDSGLSRVCVTGGEPLEQPACVELIERLVHHEKQVLVETSGAHSLSGWPRGAVYIVDIKTPSSGMADRTAPGIFEELTSQDEIKFVIGDAEDYAFARECIRRHRLLDRSAVTLGCVFGVLSPATLAGWILEDRLEVRLQLQLHKIIWPPETRGV